MVGECGFVVTGRAHAAIAANRYSPASPENADYNQPFSLASRAASALLRTASFWIAVER